MTRSLRRTGRLGATAVPAADAAIVSEIGATISTAQDERHARIRRADPPADRRTADTQASAHAALARQGILVVQRVLCPTRSGPPGCLRRAPALVVELPNRALEALVQRTGDVGRHRSETRPLRLRVAHFLLGGTPPRLVVLDAAPRAAHRVGGQPLAPLLRQQLGRREVRRPRRRPPATARAPRLAPAASPSVAASIRDRARSRQTPPARRRRFATAPGDSGPPGPAGSRAAAPAPAATARASSCTVAHQAVRRITGGGALAGRSASSSRMIASRGSAFSRRSS